MVKQIKLIIVLSVFVYTSFSYLYAQEKADVREDAMQHYRQGKIFYSQGRYQEATSEFKRAFSLITPPEIQFQERIQKEQEKILAPGSFQEAANGFKTVTPLIIPPEVEFAEKVATQQEKVLAPPLSKSPSFQEKLIEKKKEEKKEEEEKKKEEAVTRPALTGEAAPETQEAKEREYYIDMGDVLDISVWRMPEKLNKEYLIGIGDVLDISVWQVPDLSRPEVIVRPDGKISFPLLGDIKTEGLTLTQLDNVITEKLKTYVKIPEVSIMVRRFGEQAVIPDLSRPEVIVRPDGKISFPLLGDIKTEGLTLTQLDNVITEKLKTFVRALEVSIMVRRFGEQANKIVILGEIPGPGVYKFSGPPSITEVIASAGGYTKYAVLNSVMVIRGDVRTKPEVIRVNFAQIIKSGRLSQNIFLRPNDIVYVPRSFIGNINTFLEIFQPAISEYMQYMNARQFHNIMHRN